MAESTSNMVERSLNLTLPGIYSDLIDNPPPFASGQGLGCYLWILSEALIEENYGYKMDPNDLSDIDDGSIWGGLKRILFYGSKAKIIDHRRKYLQDWVAPKRFMIGSDGGEETFFIHLDDSDCEVWAFDLETGKTSKRFNSIDNYVKYVETIGGEDT